MPTLTSTELGAVGRYINLGTPAALNNLGAQTIIVYCRPTASGEGNFGYFFGKVPTGLTTGLRFFMNTDNRLSFGAHSGTSARPQNIDAVGINLNTWQHFEMTWDGTVNAAGIDLYRNGVSLTGNETSGTGSIVNDSANPAFLMNRFGIDRAFIGDVAYIARWNRVLSEAERTTVRTTGPLDVPSGLVLCWANQADLGPNALTPTERSAHVAGELPPNTALGGDSADTDPPVITGPSGAAGESTSAKNHTEGTTAVHTFTATDASLPLTWSLNGGADVARFAINSSTGALSFVSAPSFASPTDADSNNVYVVGVRATDTASNAATQTVSVTVVAAVDTTPPVITGPSGIAGASTSVKDHTEGTTAVHTFTATDASLPVTWSLDGGADVARFGINSSTGALSFLSAPSFASPTDSDSNNIYVVGVRATDTAGNAATQTVSVTVLASGTAIKGVRIRLHNGVTPRASVTGLSAVWWDSTTPHAFVAPVFTTNAASTDGAGDLQLNLNATTALSIGASGMLLLYKLDGADHRDSLVFFGRASIIDIA